MKYKCIKIISLLILSHLLSIIVFMWSCKLAICLANNWIVHRELMSELIGSISCHIILLPRHQDELCIDAGFLHLPCLYLNSRVLRASDSFYRTFFMLTVLLHCPDPVISEKDPHKLYPPYPLLCHMVLVALTAGVLLTG